jgi:hypothetical protein
MATVALVNEIARREQDNVLRELEAVVLTTTCPVHLSGSCGQGLSLAPLQRVRSNPSSRSSPGNEALALLNLAFGECAKRNSTGRAGIQGFLK